MTEEEHGMSLEEYVDILWDTLSDAKQNIDKPIVVRVCLEFCLETLKEMQNADWVSVNHKEN